MNLPLPKETRKYIGNDENRILQMSNLGLLFNKFFYNWTNDWQSNEEQNKLFRKDIEATIAKVKLPKDKDYINELNNRKDSVLKSLQNSGWHIESFPAITDSRLIIGLGGTSVIETGMTLHPLYGFPYLPGSGLKGLARVYAEIAEDFPDEETKKKLLHEIFGSDDKDPREVVSDNRQGKVFFMDGLPTQLPKLELDIMNPHYTKYYQGEKDNRGNPVPPADYLHPVPVTFLTIKAGEKFSFAVYSRDANLLAKAKELLIGGLTKLGAGGKTNVEYGYFKEDISKSDKVSHDTKSLVTKPSTISVETIKWENATLTWSPGNQMLKAIKDNLKAELKVSDRSIVPAEHHEKLFVKRKSVTANIIVEKIGNEFKIIKIS